MFKTLLYLFTFGTIKPEQHQPQTLNEVQDRISLPESNNWNLQKQNAEHAQFVADMLILCAIFAHIAVWWFSGNSYASNMARLISSVFTVNLLSSALLLDSVTHVPHTLAIVVLLITGLYYCYRVCLCIKVRSHLPLLSDDDYYITYVVNHKQVTIPCANYTNIITLHLQEGVVSACGYKYKGDTAIADNLFLISLRSKHLFVLEETVDVGLAVLAVFTLYKKEVHAQTLDAVEVELPKVAAPVYEIPADARNPTPQEAYENVPI
ncbi:NS3 protein [Hipposideros bat coronavirus]|nr:NS3 protein [Hipposideros bat coronavirus]